MLAGPSPAGPWGWTEGAFLSPALSLLLCKPPPAGLGAPHRMTRCRLSPSLPPQYPVATPLSPLGVSGTSGRDPACCSPSAAPSPGLGTLLRVLGGPPSRGLHCSPPVPTVLPRAVRPGGPRPPGVSLVPAGGASSSPGTRPQGEQGPRQLSALSRGFKARATCQGFLVAVQSGPGQRA